MTKKELRKKLKKTFTRDRMAKAIALIGGLALIATSILPYLLIN